MGRLFAALVLFGVLLSGHASATFIDHRIGDKYIIVGADSRSLGMNASDRFCKVRVLDARHFFAGEGMVVALRGLPTMDNFAESVFHQNPNASAEELLVQWMSAIAGPLKQWFDEHPADMPSSGQPLPVMHGVFGEVGAGSIWTTGLVAMNPDRVTWRQDKGPVLGPRHDFITISDRRDLAAKFFAETGASASDSSAVDAMTMRRLIEFVIQHSAPQDGIGGSPVVVALEYGKPPRWVAGGDICGQ